MAIYVAPAWSWANLDGPVMSDMEYYLPDSSLTYCVEVLDAFVNSEDPSGLHSFVSSKLVLRGISVWGHALPLYSQPDFRRHVHKFQLTHPIQHTDTSEMRSNEIEVIWDENLTSATVDPERWPSLREEQESNLLFMIVRNERSSVFFQEGLVLRKLRDSPSEGDFVRMGVFMSYKNDAPDIADLFSARLEYPVDDLAAEDISLYDPRLADLVHTVAII